ncbi:hypothetical protein [Amphibacillus cookii]|uniref:hypothetical protein n=1 Tax=Amphibacillus cookii TaxID=767787 RepID=UPI0019574FA8|nr:hypothetical protein [Amphibacillus cookii]MBM7541987.1 hypothetical protein [Amphibacillus cookii]
MKEGVDDLKASIIYFIVTFCLIIASFFGLYGQDLAYAINEYVPTVTLTTAITLVTFTSIGIYIMIPLICWISKYVKRREFMIITRINCILGLPISIWSLFVWVMWMG